MGFKIKGQALRSGSDRNNKQFFCLYRNVCPKAKRRETHLKFRHKRKNYFIRILFLKYFFIAFFSVHVSFYLVSNSQRVTSAKIFTYKNPFIKLN